MAALTVIRTENERGTVRPGLWGVAIIAAASGLVPAVALLVATPEVRVWYVQLPKPTWTAPEWLFGPVWTALYALMAVAASIVWLSRKCDDVCCPLAAFGIQLALNLAWIICFFSLKSPLLGFLDVCLLWVMVAVTTAEFFIVSRLAGWLMVPYWAWVSYAGALNAAILLIDG